MFSTIISTYNYFVFLPCSYERSDAPSEVTRMLMDEPDELEEYVLSSRDKWATPTLICALVIVFKGHFLGCHVVISQYSNCITIIKTILSARV